MPSFRDFSFGQCCVPRLAATSANIDICKYVTANISQICSKAIHIVTLQFQYGLLLVSDQQIMTLCYICVDFGTSVEHTP